LRFPVHALGAKILSELAQPASTTGPETLAPGAPNPYRLAPDLILTQFPAPERMSIEEFDEDLALELAPNFPANLRS
jgi:hypothetical protein